MGICDSINLKKYPESKIFQIDSEKEAIINNSIGTINFKELFMEFLSPSFLNLFKQNSKLFYSQDFLEGICYEYGLMDNKMDKTAAFKIYQKGADYNNDYLCMYRLHRIFLTDFKDFGLKRNNDLDRFYLYKCIAYSPYLIIKKNITF
jgi:hypothetical protein